MLVDSGMMDEVAVFGASLVRRDSLTTRLQRDVESQADGSANFEAEKSSSAV